MSIKYLDRFRGMTRQSESVYNNITIGMRATPVDTS